MIIYRSPPRPLLVTFDDGWLDNLTVALPILERHRIPAAIFIASSVLDDADEIWWHDLVVFGWNSGALNSAAFKDFRVAIGLALDNPETNPWKPGVTLLDIIVAAARLDANSRCILLHALRHSRTFAPPRQMLNQSAFEQLAQHPLIEIGSHGDSHLPITYLDNPLTELSAPLVRLQHRMGRSPSDNIFSMSFPHGRYDHQAVKQARALGYELIFTSDAVLNPINGLGLPTLGRIGIPPSQILDDNGAFAADRLATWLFARTAQHTDSPV